MFAPRVIVVGDCTADSAAIFCCADRDAAGPAAVARLAWQADGSVGASDVPLLYEPPYLYGVLFRRDLRGELVRTGFETVVNLLLMGILLDAVFQWVILGVSHPGAALVVGPVLIVGPYSLARALSNRLARLRGHV